MAQEHEMDVCECGDYRRQHAPGGGPCSFNKSARGGGIGHGIAGDCGSFRLFRRHGSTHLGNITRAWVDELADAKG